MKEKNIEINCYQCDESIVKSIALLLTKIIEEKKRAFILLDTENQESAKQQAKDIDEGLWSFGKTKFIGHSTIFEKDFNPERQPVLISNQEENINNSDYLILTTKTTKNFISKFEKACYFYNEDSNYSLKIISQLREVAGKFNSYKKFQGKWIEK